MHIGDIMVLFGTVALRRVIGSKSLAIFSFLSACRNKMEQVATKLHISVILSILIVTYI